MVCRTGIHGSFGYRLVSQIRRHHYLYRRHNHCIRKKPLLWIMVSYKILYSRTHPCFLESDPAPQSSSVPNHQSDDKPLLSFWLPPFFSYRSLHRSSVSFSVPIPIVVYGWDGSCGSDDSKSRTTRELRSARIVMEVSVSSSCASCVV